jgi:gem associated protein 7
MEEEQQAQRTFLRERFLRLLTAIANQPAEFVLHNGKKVSANFCASDIDVLQFQVSKLETPIGTLPMAILRSTDIMSFTVALPSPASDIAQDIRT